MSRLDSNKEKLLALGSVSKLAGIENYRVSRWFYGQTTLESYELSKIISALRTAKNRSEALLQRAEQEYQEIIK
jgi:hypothetical protein